MWVLEQPVSPFHRLPLLLPTTVMARLHRPKAHKNEEKKEIFFIHFGVSGALNPISWANTRGLDSVYTKDNLWAWGCICLGQGRSEGKMEAHRYWFADIWDSGFLLSCAWCYLLLKSSNTVAYHAFCIDTVAPSAYGNKEARPHRLHLQFHLQLTMPC